MTRRSGFETRRVGSSAADRRRLGRLDLGSRLSWSGIVAGLFVALAVQITLTALGVWAGFGLAEVTDVEALADISATVGIWIAVSALIAIFLAGMVASWIGGSATVANGLWHGVAVWGLVLTVAVMLSVFGVSGLLGFATTPGQLVESLPAEVPEADLAQAVTTSADFAGWFLLGSVLSLAGALLGGWIGTLNAGRRAMMGEETAFDEHEERRAA